MYLSIIVPFFNAENYIRDCVESLLDQGLKAGEFEILLINDGSTDGSSARVEDLCNTNEDLILINDINRGVYFQRNNGLKLSRGKYIFFMDADDYLVSGALARLLDYAIANDLQLLGFQSEITHTRYKDLENEPIDEEFNLKIQSGSEYLVTNPNTRLEIWWYLLRRDYLESTEISFYEGHYYADAPFTIEVWINASRVAFCPLPLHRYYQSDNSIVRSKSNAAFKKKYDSYIRMFKKVENIIKEMSALNPVYKDKLIQIVKMRMDQHAVNFFIGIFRSQLSYSYLKNAIISLKAENVYPMKNFINSEYADFKAKAFIAVLNQPLLLKIAFIAYRSKRRFKY